MEQQLLEQLVLEQLVMAVALAMRARLVIAAVITAAVLLVALVAGSYADHGLGEPWTFGVLTVVVLAAWCRPLIVYRGRASEAVNADEGLILVALLLLPPLGVVTVVAVAAAIAQVVHRRTWVKGVFNWADALVAVTAAVLVTRLLGLGTAGSVSFVELTAAMAGVATFFVLSALIVAGILAVTGRTTVGAALRDGADLRLMVLAAGVVLAAPIGLAAGTATWAVGLLPPLYFGLRWVLAGRFNARHDRDRLLGLFDATLTVHRPLAAEDVRAELTQVAGELLRCPQARLSAQDPGAMELASRLDGEWLALAGRQHSEPYDAADQRLLDALAAVGRSALSHAEMYARAQRQSDELTAIMGGLAEGVIAFDAEGWPAFLNPAAEALLGTTPEAFLASEATGSVDSARGSLMAISGRCLQSRTSVSDESAFVLRCDGSRFSASYSCAPLLDGEVAVGAVLVFRDVSERLAAERQLAYNAFHDELTGLPNRRLFLDRLDQALLRGARSGGTHAVLLADIDRFKLINDNLGQQAGDELLREIARRIGAVARPSDTLARFGGDQFTLLVEDSAEADMLAARIVQELAVPVQLSEGRELVASVSIGIALAHGEVSGDDVLHDVDVAMSQAKSTGVGRVHAYNAAAMRGRSAARFDLEADLRAALAADELEVYYQPKIDLQTGTIHDVEALIRWPDPKVGLRMPGEFIGIAEESGLILPLGRFVLSQAALQAHLWAATGARVNVAVNLSARQFQDPGLTEQIESALEASGLPPSQLCLEVTESLAMQDLDLTVRTLWGLKALGVDLAIDDFGTGHSSLSYLKKFPVDEVKIDRSFIQDLASSPVDGAIVSAIVGLATALGMRTVVEGIEDADQLERVRELGCSLAQGYHVSRPKTARDVTSLLTCDLVPSPRLEPPRLIDLTQVRSHH